MTDFFTPDSVAVIGASAHPHKLGHQLMKNLIDGGYTGKIFPVNLDEKRILGLKAHHSILDISDHIEMAVIIVPREAVLTVLEECQQKKVDSVLIISAGFAEKDEAGKKLQQQMTELVRRSKMRLIGPNCLGIINSHHKMNLTFALAKFSPGEMGLVLQSGAIGSAILDWAKENELGISKFISLGNMADVSELDALKLLADDPKTKVIALYLEEIKNPAEFIRICRRITLKKPIIVLKGGMTESGQKAAASHTGAISSSVDFIKAVFKQADLIEAESYEELINFLYLFSFKHVDIMSDSIAVVTNAGGPGIIATDAAYKVGLRLRSLPRLAELRLTKKLDRYASLRNPFDLGGDALAKDYQVAIDYLMEQKMYSAIVTLVTPQTSTEIEKTTRVFRGYEEHKKPLIAVFMGGASFKKTDNLLAKNTPWFEDPTEAIALLGKIMQYQHNESHLSREIEIKPRRVLSEAGEEKLAHLYHLDYVETDLAENDAKIFGFVEEHGFPVAVKTAKEIAHKGKAGKVGLNIADHHSLKRAISHIGYPLLIQKMIDSPYEIFIGARRDPVFGVVLFFGQGGIFVEELRDVSTRVMPLTTADLEAMIEETKVYSAIKSLNVQAEIKILMKAVLQIMEENYDIESLDLNPIKVLKNKLVTVDINIGRKND